MSGFLIFTQPDEDGNVSAVDLGNLYATGKDGEKLVNVYKIPPAGKQRIIGRHELPEQEWPDAEADNDGCFKILILLIAVGAAAVMGFMPRYAYAQQWQPTTWPPPAWPGCSGEDNPGLARPGATCAQVAVAVAEINMRAYELNNGLRTGVYQPQTVVAQRVADATRNYAQTGRYANEAWMWQPAPQAQAQWQQQRRRWRQ